MKKIGLLLITKMRIKMVEYIIYLVISIVMSIAILGLADFIEWKIKKSKKRGENV